MLKRLSPRERFEALLAEYEPIIRRAFLEAVADLRSGVALRVVIDGKERAISNLTPIPGAGTVVAWKAWCAA